MSETVKVICCDIDGTLVRDDKSLSEENIRWIHRAVHEAGVHFILVSGRMVNGVRPFYERMGITGPVSCYNGGMLVDEDGNIVDDNHRMPHDIAMALMDVREKFPDVSAIIFDGMKWFLETKDCYAYEPKVKIYESDCSVGDFRVLLKSFDTNKFLFMSPVKGRLEEVRAEIEKALDERRAELALEENRFFDLVRWGKAPEVLGPLGFKAGKNELFPIPSAQRQLNTNLPATPGYTY